MPQQMGDVALGREVFRFETFGNEGFWTDAVRLPAGIMAAKVTPLQALQLGLQVDSDMVDPATKAELAKELRADPSGRSSRLLNDPNVTTKLVMAGAVIGMSPKNGKVGTSCALCHTMTDASVFKVPQGGSVGRRLDGLANHNINLGKIFATAANTRALYTIAQLQLDANKGKTLGRAPRGLTATSTEADFDAYFSNPRFYPIGMFDDTFDGNGDPMHNTPLFEQDLAAPYGSEGTFTRIDDFSNFVFTTLFDQTMLTTPGGRAFVHMLAGAAGDEMIDNYVKILNDTRVVGYPFVAAQARQAGKPGTLTTPIGFRVDGRRLLALNAYLASLPAPTGMKSDSSAIMRGRQVFRTSGCTGCHNVDQSRPVPTTIHAMAQIFPGDHPIMLAPRQPPLNAIVNTPNSFFDDKMAVVNASLRGEKRGIAMPLLLDLARKPVFLHDDSASSLDNLLNGSRGRTAPHPFYVPDRRRRADAIAYLKSLDSGVR
ncbi:hypothetical protein SCH01S_33_00290 [Sphingomonas changbaiensis NBRC 104936]|uniref:Cytochrome c domain-containing protein n=1 Tax=Sphingomonas changbaiensis NBRC 104936 TaxID=1219043 RepID=A0A0E9MP54_9SPHN|nr:hypothetical protein [Sphingomonas changbaiensis]GAO39542.1 hypothetical protein SCH01S_33_00290 [Sphingomonas changbaiensis NBRC 104936]